MTAADIIRIAVTVGVVQAACDLFVHWWIYSTEAYQRILERLQRAESKVNSYQGKIGGDKHAKRIKAAEDEKSILVATVARQHMMPNMFISILFVILMRVLASEYGGGRIIAVLPFVIPYPFLRRMMTMRGLAFQDNVEYYVSTDSIEGLSKVDTIQQACSFTFIYILATMSVKYYVHQLLGTPPPPGAENMASLADTPQGKLLMKNWTGLDVDEFKQQLPQPPQETKRKTG
jgi:Integral membrane protein EMC3/TMCO1-like